MSKVANILKIAKPSTEEWFSGLDAFLIESGYQLEQNGQYLAKYRRGTFLETLEYITVTQSKISYTKEVWQESGLPVEYSEPITVSIYLDLWKVVGMLHLVGAIDASIAYKKTQKPTYSRKAIMHTKLAIHSPAFGEIHHA